MPPAVPNPPNFEDLLARAPQDQLARPLSRAKKTFTEELRDSLRRQEINGRRCAALLALFHDQAIRALFSHATQIRHPRANPTAAENIALVATGGYGRRLMAPHSDLDLLFLLPYKPTAWSESVVETMLYTLWDMGLTVGHATRRPEECAALAMGDITIRTALLDSRFLEGNRALFDDLRGRFRRQAARAKAQRNFVEEKLRERDMRLERAGTSRYLVEPDVKNGKGGLRDLQTLLWIAHYSYGVSAPEGLAEAGLLTRANVRLFRQCEEMLWRTRCHLHFMTDRAEERLTFGTQKDMAAAFGMDDVERFMKRYFLTSKYVGDLTRVVCAVLEERQKKKRPVLGRLAGMMRLAPRLRDRALHKTPFAIERGRLAIKDADAFHANPLEVMRLFHLAATKGAPIHPDALAQASLMRQRIGKAFREEKEACRLFLETLSAAAPEDALRAMNETGILGKFIPDFGRIVAQMQFNMYHHYTVDEHLLRAVGGLADIAGGALEETLPRAKALMGEIRQKRRQRAILSMAVFLHDIAKGGERDHSDGGAAIARRLCPRLGMDAEAARETAWLVRNHLLMSDMAQRRDPSDPRTVAAFARKVETKARLDMLFLLTIADIRAVGPGVWNGWKARLLETLYEGAARRMSGVGTAPHATAVRAKKEALRARLSEGAGDFMTLHRPHYWTSLETETHARHAALYRDFLQRRESALLGAHDDPARAVTEISLVAEDHPGTFARAAGALAMARLHIVDARIFTARNGVAFDAFWVQDSEGRTLGDPKRVQRLRRLLLDVMEGRRSPAKTLAKRRGAGGGAFHISPLFRVDNMSSRQSSIFEIEGLDRPGLLHALAYALFRLGLVIQSARIATFGERAVDIFTVTDGVGQKITDDARLARIGETLLGVLEPPSPAISPPAPESPSPSPQDAPAA